MRCGPRPAPLRAMTTCWLRPSSTGPASHCHTVTHISTVVHAPDSVCFTLPQISVSLDFALDIAVDDYQTQKEFNFPLPKIPRESKLSCREFLYTVADFSSWANFRRTISFRWHSSYMCDSECELLLVSGYLTLHVSAAMRWRPDQGVNCLLPNVS